MPDTPAAAATIAPQVGDIPAVMPAHAAAHITGSPVGSANAPVQKPGGQASPDANAETFGVTPEQFTKYFDTSKGLYNWQAHAVEADYKIAQKTSQVPAAPAAVTAVPGTLPAPGAPPGPVTPPGVPDPAAAQKIAQGAGLDWDRLTNSVQEYGDIHEQDYATLEKIGIPRADIQGYIGYIKAEAQSHVDNVHGAFGGEAGFNQMKTWVQANLQRNEIDGYNEMLNGPQWQVAAETLRTKMGLPPATAAAPAGPVQTPNASLPTAGAAVVPYANQAEMVAAMKDSRYQKDPAYRADVMKKVAGSNWAAAPSHVGGLG